MGWTVQPAGTNSGFSDVKPAKLHRPLGPIDRVVDSCPEPTGGTAHTSVLATPFRDPYTPAH